MITNADFKKGIAIRHNGEPYVIIGYQFVNPGKGSAFTRTKMKHIKTGKAIEVTFKSGESIEDIDMRYQKCQYLYKDASDFYFMNNDTYDQFTLSIDVIGASANYLLDGTDVVVVHVDDRPVSLQLPPKMDFRVVSAPPGEKGDTATGGTKPVEIETGVTVAAPLFVKEGDMIRVNTDTGDYCERVNS